MSSQEIELHLIELKYAHTRILDRKSIFSMMRSLDCYGQITPVTLIPDSSKYILMDGYIRVNALAKLGQDSALAIIMDMQERTALIQALAREERRPQTSLEQACLILELSNSFQLSLSRIAQELGKDKSWVKRRLDLVQSLPANVLDLVRAGDISAWAASRVLAPLARANPEHAAKLCQYLVAHGLSTRELHHFFQAYQKSTRKIRDNMVHDPELFLKAQKHKEHETKAQSLLQGPEGEWVKRMEQVCALLRRLEPATETVFTRLEHSQYLRLQALLSQAEHLLAEVAAKAKKEKAHALTTTAGDHTADASKGDEHQGDLQASGSEPEHCAQGTSE